MASKFGVEKTSPPPEAAGAKPLFKDDVPQTEAETEEMRITSYREAGGGHVDVKHHIVRDAVESGIVRIHYVNSGEQHADVLTNALDVNTFETHARFLLNVREGLTTA